MRKNVQNSSSHRVRGHYADILRRRIIELSHFLQPNGRPQISTAEIESLHMRVYSLVGSAAIYGYNEVSDAARRLDALLNSSVIFPGSPEVVVAVNELVQSCEKALAAETSAPQVRASHLKLEWSSADQRRPVLLTIDDDPAIQDIVSLLFSDEVDVVAAYNSQDAIEAVRRYAPDLILMDNYMPGITGFTLLERLRAGLSNAPVMMLTAEKQAHAKARATASGVVDYIVKPFEPNELAEKVYEFLNRFRMTVLVASENPTECRQLAGKLRQQGLDVLEATDGKEAVRLANTHIPEMIILDECMAAPTGGSVLGLLNAGKQTRSIPVLYLTVNERGANKSEDYRPDVKSHTVTPFVPADIAARTLEMLGLESDLGSWI